MDEATEGTGRFTVTRNNGGNVQQSILAFVQMGGNASYLSDFNYQNLTGYSHPTWYVTIPAGQNSATVTITPTKDFTIEGDETLNFTLLPPVPGNGDYTLGAGTTVEMIILDLVNEIFRDSFEQD